MFLSKLPEPYDLFIYGLSQPICKAIPKAIAIARPVLMASLVRVDIVGTFKRLPLTSANYFFYNIQISSFKATNYNFQITNGSVMSKVEGYI